MNRIRFNGKYTIQNGDVQVAGLYNEEISINMVDVGISFISLMALDDTFDRIDVLDENGKVVRTYYDYKKKISFENNQGVNEKGEYVILNGVLVLSKEKQFIDSLDNVQAIATETKDGLEETKAFVNEIATTLNLNFDFEKSTLEECKEYQILVSKKELANYFAENPLQSSIGGAFSITIEKQNLMTSNALAWAVKLLPSVLGVVKESGIDFSSIKAPEIIKLIEEVMGIVQSVPIPWNETDKECIDYSIKDYVTIMVEMDAFIKPRVSKQQQYEIVINACKTKEEIKAIKFDYAEPNGDVYEEEV